MNTELSRYGSAFAETSENLTPFQLHLDFPTPRSALAEQAAGQALNSLPIKRTYMN